MFLRASLCEENACCAFFVWSTRFFILNQMFLMHFKNVAAPPPLIAPVLVSVILDSNQIITGIKVRGVSEMLWLKKPQAQLSFPSRVRVCVCVCVGLVGFCWHFWVFEVYCYLVDIFCLTGQKPITHPALSSTCLGDLESNEPLHLSTLPTYLCSLLTLHLA